MLIFDPNRIRTLRDTHKISLEEMAERLGKIKQQVSTWECGVNVPTLENLLLICNTFDVPLAFFVYSVSSTVDDKSGNA